MNEAAKRFIKQNIWIAVVLFVVRSSINIREIIDAVDSKELFKFAYSLIGYAGEAISLTAILMWAFNKWLWRWKLLNYLAGGMPILAKHYKGKIRFGKDGEIQEQDSEIWIKQSFLNVSIKLGTEESFSDTITATIETLNNEMQLVYTYLNTPCAELQDRSAIHYGTALLCVSNPKRLTGNYYTSRLSRGSMVFEEQ